MRNLVQVTKTKQALKNNQKKVEEAKKTALYYQELFLIDGISNVEQKQLNKLFKTVEKLEKKLKKEILKLEKLEKKLKKHEFQTIVYDDAIVATDDIAKDFQTKSNEEGLGDIYLTLVVDFKVTALIILDSKGSPIHT